MDVIREYKFLIAFENSDCYDYVTEKVYNGLNAGAIPIYMGAPNIIEFVPDHSIINAADFSSPESLARYINVVNNNDDLYASYVHRFSARKTKYVKQILGMAQAPIA